MTTLVARPLPVLVLILVLVAASAGVPAPADAQLNVTGQWSTLPYLSPINPVHVALLKDGKVLIVGGSENNQNNTIYKTAVWNPATGTFNQQTTPWDLFCNGMSFLPDGRVIMTGGNVQYDPFFGPPWTTIFDPATEQFYRVEDMAGGRWYPTNTPLADGGTLVFGGLDEVGATNNTVEIYDVAGGWTPPYPANFAPGWYPRLHLLPNGKVFMSGPTTPSKTFDPSQGTWWSGGLPTNYGQSRLYGSSVLLPMHPDDGYKPRVMIFGGNTQTATNTVEFVDLGVWPEEWVTKPSMSVPRVTMNAVLLPNGKILTFGGSTQFNDPATAHYGAETYDPGSETWTPSGTMAYHRLYHSSALLLPDATVWVAGSNPTRSTWIPQMEIYKPPYLFTATGAPATRPTITSAPAVVGYGQTFTVNTPDAAGVSKVLLIRPGSNTHAFDQEQRLIHMYFTKGAGTLSVTAPTKEGAAPPGYYMLFILNASGVPSVATFIQVKPNPTNQLPTATITNPSTSTVNVQPGQSVTFAGSASDPDGSIARYAWIFPGGSPGTSAADLPNPATVTVTFPIPGVYTVSLTVLDNQGDNNPSPPTVTVVVGTQALGASITSPTNGATVNGTVSVNMVATNIQGSPTQFVLKLDNTTTLSTQSIPNGTTATYAWNTAGVSSGPHTLNLTVIDGAGRTATAAVNVTVSTGGGGGPGPSVAITAPPNGAWTGNSIRVTATATAGGAPLTSIKIYGNGGVVLTQNCTASPCTLDNWWTTGPLPNAAYQIQAVATDAGGTWTTSPPVTIYKNATTPVVPSGAPASGGGDTTPPTVSVSGPSEGSTVSGTVTLTATANDNVGVVGVQFKVDGVNVGSEDTTAPYSVPWTTTTSTNGSHTLTAVARDAAGHTTTSSPITVMVANGGDTTPPSVMVTAPVNGAMVTGTVTVTATASDDLGVVGVQFKLDGVNLGAEDTTAPYSLPWTTNGVPNGSHTLTAVARDGAGNVTTSTPVTVTVSNSGGGGPGVTLSAPPNAVWIGNSVRVTATATSTGPALASIKIYGNGGIALTQNCSASPCTLDNWWVTGPLPNSAYQIQAVATDVNGVWTTTPAVVVYKNATSPIVPSGAPPSGGGDMTGPAVSITGPAEGATVSGAVTVSAAATDNMGVVGVQFHVDGVTVGAEDTTAPYEILWNTAGATSGAHTLTAVARDAAGNTTTSATVTVMVADTTPPTAAMTAPAEGATVSLSVTVSATASDDVGVAGVQFQLDGANLGAELTTAPYTLSWDTTTATNGTHALTAVARDAAGNTTASAPVTVTVFNDGNPAPTVAISTPPNGAWIGNSVRVTATANDEAGLTTVKLWGNGGVFFTQNCAGATSCTADTWWVTGSLPNAAYQIQAVATDVGAKETISAGVTVNKNATSPVVPSGAAGGGGGGGGGDSTAPTVAVTAPAGGSTVSGATMVTASASDNVGVAGVQFTLNGVNLGAEDTTAPYAIAWDTTTAANGDHVLTAVARDAAGNTTTSAAVSVTVSNSSGGGGDDTTPPSVTITTPFNGDWTGNSIKVSATATDNVGLASIKLYGNGTLFSTGSCGGVTLCEHTAWWSTATLPPGQHTITAVATDLNGNETTSAPVTINK